MIIARVYNYAHTLRIVQLSYMNYLYMYLYTDITFHAPYHAFYVQMMVVATHTLVSQQCVGGTWANLLRLSMTI